MKQLKNIGLILLALTLTISCDECFNTECLNGGTCSKGSCICDDGISRPICKMDTCIKTSACKNGHCEYGNCICDEYWIGEKCDSLTYIDHSGEFFGSFTCNAYSVTTDIVEVEKTAHLDTFWFHEVETQYQYKVGFINTNRFQIPHQRENIDGGGWVNIAGSGEVRDGILTMDIDYRFYDEFGYSIGYTTCDFDGDKKINVF